MNVKTIMRGFVLSVLPLLICGGIAYADALDVQERLSKELKIELKDVTIAEAFAKIGQKANVPIVLSDEAAWKLPQGEATRLSVKLDGPLAESLTEMLNTFFMRYATDNNQVTIYPKQELEHILGRPTTSQLELLRRIYSNPIRVYYQNELQKSINEALGTEILISPINTHEQLNNLLRLLVGKEQKPRQTDVNEPTGQKYNLPTPVTLVQMINQIGVQIGGRNSYPPELTRWYISGMDFPGQIPEIKVVDLDSFRNAKLGQKIDVSYKDAPLDKIFQDLANRGGLNLSIAPGLHLNDYRISVNIQNLTALEAIEKVADITGSVVERNYPDVYIRSIIPKDRENQSGKTQSSDCSGNYVGKISVPMNGGEYFIEFMLRECDLSDEFKNLRKEKLNEILKQFSKSAEPKQPKSNSAK